MRLRLNQKCLITTELQKDKFGNFLVIVTSAETIPIPEESRFRLLDHFQAFCSNWNRNWSQNELNMNRFSFFRFTIPHFRDRQKEL